MQTADFFRARLDGMIDLAHPLAVLAARLPWVELDAELAPNCARPSRDDVIVDGGAFLAEPGGALHAAGVSYAGRPCLSIRLLYSLVYLKQAFNLSDESLVERWSENVVWQYFSGLDYYEPRLPCDATQIGRFGMGSSERTP
jgi:transposase, IS5 family